jgi:hypothetical protein
MATRVRSLVAFSYIAGIIVNNSDDLISAIQNNVRGFLVNILYELSFMEALSAFHPKTVEK